MSKPKPTIPPAPRGNSGMRGSPHFQPEKPRPRGENALSPDIFTQRPDTREPLPPTGLRGPRGTSSIVPEAPNAQPFKHSLNPDPYTSTDK
jgi:hypothetical protein